MPTPATGLDVTPPKGFWTQPLTADQRASAQLKYKPETSWGTLAASTFNTPIRNDLEIAASIVAPVTYTMTVSGLTEAQARDIRLVLEGKLKSTKD